MTGSGARETFGSRFGVLATMIGVAVGLGNVWRFPYMVGKFGGAPFVAVYALAVLLLGVPTLMAEWTLGRRTRRGPVGAFELAGLPAGRAVGWFFFAVVTAATAYYTNALGWVLYHAIAELLGAVGVRIEAGAILPPARGVDPRSLTLQIASTGAVIAACATVLMGGLRRGIERASKVIMPVLLCVLSILIVRSLTLEGMDAGLRWFLLDARLEALTPAAVMAALGQAFFSLSLGGTFMVVYGSYLGDGEPLAQNAGWTAAGDLTAGLMAGLAVLPAVFAFGLAPSSGPGLIFSTLPKVFDALPAGWLFGLLFFAGLTGAAFLSDVAAFEVLVAGLTDATGLDRRRAIRLLAAVVFVLALPSMINLEIFVPWDLAFGSGMQTLGALVAVVAVGWRLDRSGVVRDLGGNRALWLWVRYAVPGILLAVGAWWFGTEVLGL